MADTPSGSGSGPPPAKAIGSLARKPSDVTRQGSSKLKFVPTLPQRRKKEDVKPEPTATTIPASQPEGRGRGRGRGAARGMDGGRGRGRGAPPPVMMTASGPFAMGPAMAGNAGSRRSTPRSNFAPSLAPSTSGSSSLGAGLSQTAPPSLKKDLDPKGKGKEVKQEDEEEVYSDQEDGVEIIDIDNVRSMDWMAPESIRKEKKPAKKVKKEKSEPEAAAGEVNAANALDLSESEEEEEEPELEDVIEDFATRVNIDTDDASLREERLYLFQFPTPFPTFLPQPKSPQPAEDVEMVDATPEGSKKVSFGPDVKPPAEATPATSRTVSTAPPEGAEPQHLDGLIGRLEVYRSGAVKIRMDNGIVLDVNPATQPSFLQQAVYIDRTEKRLTVLGEVNKQFVASPDVDVLLQALEDAEKAVPEIPLEGEEMLIKM